MRKVFHVALRDFKATVLTKAFLMGVLIPPLIMVVVGPLALMLINKEPPSVSGVVRVVDLSTGATAAPRIAEKLAPEALREKALADSAEAQREAAKQMSAMLSPAQAAQAEELMKAQLENAARNVPVLTVETPALEPDANAQIDALKQALVPAAGAGPPGAGAPLALVVVRPNAVTPAPDGRFESFDLYVRPKLDMRVQQSLKRQVREAVVDARLAASGHDPTPLRVLMRLDMPETVEVTVAGDKTSSELRQMFVPLAFMILLWITVFAGGQMLLTSTIEEKSNRVMEVLLSAVSPMQLMSGKILGQMAASLMILVLYAGLGVSGLAAFNRSDIVEWHVLGYLVIFFFLAYFTIASMMAAIGSAVNDLHEANALLTPIMLVIIMPMVLMMPIILNPKGALATTLSFIPPLNSFVMVLRISSTDPPPSWQVWASILVGIVGAYLMLRVTAKVFRVGVLMYGKAPNFATLIRWVRMA